MGQNSGAPSIPLAQKGFVDAGHKPYYLVLKQINAGSRKNKEFYNGFWIYRFRIPHLLNKISNRLYLNNITSKIHWFWFCIFSFIAALRPAKKIKPDIVIGYTFYGALPAYLISKIYRIPYIFREIGTMSFYQEIQTFWGRLKQFNQILAYKLPCSAMILTDDGTCTNLAAKQLGVPDKKIYFWKNGIFKINSLNKNEARKQLGLGDDKKVIISIGRLGPFKRMGSIIESIPKVASQHNCLYIIIGEGPERKNFEKLTENLGVHEKILFTGQIPHEQIWNYLAASDLVVALGAINPLLEGMTAGRCVITLDLGSTKQFVEDKKTGIVIEESDLKNLGQFISEILKNDNKRQEIEQNAQKYIKENFEDWESRIKKEIQLIENLFIKKPLM
jgi:glycosyltransferase involved in cell wall biosynthesis